MIMEFEYKHYAYSDLPYAIVLESDKHKKLLQFNGLDRDTVKWLKANVGTKGTEYEFRSKPVDSGSLKSILMREYILRFKNKQDLVAFKLYWGGL